MVKTDLSIEVKTFIATLLISLVVIFVGILINDIGILGNIIILSIFFVVIPQLILNYIKYRDLEEIELRYPIFLRDLVESARAGLPLHKAIISVSRTDYGPLNKEVKKMAHQLSWSVNIIKVLEQSRDRLKKNESLNRIIRVLIETYKSGGSVDETLESLANTLSTIQETKKERQSTLSQYVVAMYALTFVFIGIVVGINRLLVPIFSASSLGTNPISGVIGNPCEACIYGGDFSCSPCYIYLGVCNMMGIDITGVSCYYVALFYSMAAIQAISGGLIAGQIGEGSLQAGIKHSLILFLASSGIFFILVRIGLLGG